MRKEGIDLTPPVISYDSAAGLFTVTDRNLEKVLMNGKEESDSFTISPGTAYKIEALDKTGNNTVLDIPAVNYIVSLLDGDGNEIWTSWSR